MNSITWRITGLVFFAVAVTVITLLFLANLQMTQQFQEYLIQHTVMNQAVPHDMNSPEQTFLTSVHQSLIWVGAGILIIGLAASYALARSITVPLRKLSSAVEQIERGNFNQKVSVESQDEVGHLAAIFNRMAETLTINNRLRRQLLANIAHELKTPLAVIQGHLEGMMDGVIDTDKQQLASLHEEAIRLNRLINDLKELSLAEVGQLALEKYPADINQIIGRVVGKLRRLADEKAIDIYSDLAEGTLEVWVDSDRISQVFYNILVNAIRYSPHGGVVGVATQAITENGLGWVKVSVRDNGSGIDPSDLPYIFDQFYRGDKSRDRKSGGTGLGLAIVKQLVENHGGRVAVESVIGEGSVFYVLLPADANQLGN